MPEGGGVRRIVTDQRIEPRPPLGLENRSHSLRIRRVGTQPIDRLGTKRDQPAGAQQVCRSRHAFEVRLQDVCHDAPRYRLRSVMAKRVSCFQLPRKRTIVSDRPSGDITYMLDITFAKPALPRSGALVLLIHEGEKASGLWAQLDETTGGAIARALQVAEFKGAKGKTCTILAPGANLTRVLVVGLGKPADATQKILEEAGGAIIATLSREDLRRCRQHRIVRATGLGSCARSGSAQLPLRSVSNPGKA